MTSSVANANARISQVRQQMNSLSPKRQGGSFSQKLENEMYASTSVAKRTPEETKLTKGEVFTNPPVMFQKASAVTSVADTTGVLKNADKYADIIESAAKEFNVNPSLIRGIIQTESSFNPKAVSRVGAQGLMQLMPGTAKELGVTDPFDPEQNIRGGTKYISQLLKRFDGDVKLAVASYNTGPGRISKLGITPNTSNPQDYLKISSGVQGYVNKVLKFTNVFLGNS